MEEERRWLRGQVLRMLDDGWTLQELEEIGFKEDLLRSLGILP